MLSPWREAGWAGEGSRSRDAAGWARRYDLLMLNPFLAAAAAAFLGGPQPDTITLFQDDTVIDRSCNVIVPPDTVIRDANGDGVIQIKGDGITVRFMPGAVLRGSEPGAAPDTYSGCGIRVIGGRGVTVIGGAISGFKQGLWATNTDALTLEGIDASHNYRQRLRSTPAAEDGSDWLWPHKNDGNEWATNYGGALIIEDSKNATVKDCTVRHGQNGLILDRVTDSKVYDNDFSFNSGWGIAMWRCTGNTISRNAIDFNVRGHSEGVYNRGQDSAGILFFEQNSSNAIAENSATHGGDGFFAFAGLEALNGEGAPPGYDHTRKGCNDNILIGNDFSYAPAHGVEITFSFGNVIARNRMVENAICGIWGGYSQETFIAENEFAGNGGMGYGLERGGVNIEHGAHNLILNNTFTNDRCGVHLWWDGHGDFAEKTWGKANYKGVTGNIIAGNTFTIDDSHPFTSLRPEARLIAVHLRDDGEGNLRGNRFMNNTTRITSQRGVLINAPDSVRADLESLEGEPIPVHVIPSPTVYGSKKPVGARPHLRGRDKIIMTEWGPWDHESPLVRRVGDVDGGHVYEFHGIEAGRVGAAGVGVNFERQLVTGPGPWKYTVRAATPGVHRYTITVDDPNHQEQLSGVIVRTSWDCTFFSWDSIKVEGPTPPPDLEAWRALANSDTAVKATLPSLKFNFGSRGPSTMNISEDVTKAAFADNYFGVIAATNLDLPKGRWKFTTRSDDGVRVRVNGNTIIENWTHHGSAVDTATFDSPGGRAKIEVEYFEIFGAAVLEFQIEPMP